MASHIKSLRHNLAFGVDVPFHRSHVSKKNKHKGVNDVDSKRYKKRLEELKLRDIEKYGL